MLRRLFTRVLLTVWVVSGASVAGAAEIVIYGFEETAQGWAIPDWAKASNDYVSRDAMVSTTRAEEGQSALELRVSFPGDRWTGAYVEREVEVTDWSRFGQLSVSLYVPADAPEELIGRLILTVGEDWTWTEMNHGVPLQPGAWTGITANLKPGSLDWKFFPEESFRKDVRKLGVRVESDKRPVYTGSVFVDNVRLAE